MNVVITGASSGLGEYLAVELAARGHAIGLIARRESALNEVAAKVRAHGVACAVAPADVTDREALHAAVRAIEATLGATDLLVANAGAGDDCAATRLDARKIAAMFRLNVEGVAYAFEAVLPAMLARGGGHVAAVSSLAGWRGISGAAGYSATKAAVSTLLEGWRAELAPFGVAVTTIHPGFVKTPLTDKNRFPMPFLMAPEAAARVMADGLLARRREVNFPRPMVLFMRLVRALPGWAFEPLIRRMSPPPKPKALGG